MVKFGKMNDGNLGSPWPFAKLNPFWKVGILLFCLLLFIRIFYDFNGLFGQDPHEYYRFHNDLKYWLSSGEKPAPFFWPVFYSMLGALIAFPFPDSPIVLQLISMLSLIGTLYFTCKTIQFYFPQTKKTALLYSFLLIGLSPYLIRAGLQIGTDSIGTFACTASLYFILQYGKQANWKWWLGACFAMTAAFFSRYAGAVVLFVPGIYFLVSMLKQQKWFHLILGPGLPALIYILTFAVKNGEVKTGLTDHNFIALMSLKNFFLSDFHTEEGITQNMFPNLIYAFQHFFHPGYLLLGLPLLGISLVKLKKLNLTKLWLPLASILIYGLFLALIPRQNPRFLLLTLPFVVVCLFPAFLWFRENTRLNKNLVNFALGLLVLLQVGLGMYSLRKFAALNHLEKEVAEGLNTYPKERIFTFILDAALPNYGVENEMVNMYFEDMDLPMQGDLCLFNPLEFKDQWKGSQLLKNWNFIQNNYQLEEKQEFSQGWKLFAIKNS